MKNEFHKKIEDTLKQKYPSLADKDLDFSNLASPYIVKVPKSIFEIATRGMEQLFKLSQHSAYKAQLTEVDNDILSAEATNNSLLMAYDFHISVDQGIPSAKLIEVNTNASGFLFVNAINEFQFDPQQAQTELSNLIESFAGEVGISPHAGSKKIAIIDEDVFEQKMFVEFLMYKDLLNQNGYQAEIYDAEELKFIDNELHAKNSPVGFVYNRFCDFTLSEDRSSDLRKAYLEQANYFSPQPREYILQADKQRLIELSQPGWVDQFADHVDISAIKEVLLPSFDIHSLGSADDLWKIRKKYFFKPKNAFGGKSTYRGSSISKKVFQRLFEENSLVQEFAPPSIETFDEAEWKYDLRIYAYKGKPQAYCARLFQGQLTNFKTPLGGFAAVELT